MAPEEVADYLLDNPDFFLEHSELITEMNFPHETNGAVSLIERQVQVLRQEQKDNKNLIAELTANANANHELLKKMQALTLDLMKASDTSELLTSLDSHMRGHFSLDQIQILIESSAVQPDLPFVQYLESSKITQMHSDIFNLNVYVGRVPTQLSDYFSKESLQPCQSIALIKLNNAEDESNTAKYLLLGSSDETRFQSDMATDFIEYVGNILALRMALLPSNTSDIKDSE